MSKILKSAMAIAIITSFAATSFGQDDASKTATVTITGKVTTDVSVEATSPGELNLDINNAGSQELGIFTIAVNTATAGIKWTFKNKGKLLKVLFEDDGITRLPEGSDYDATKAIPITNFTIETSLTSTDVDSLPKITTPVADLSATLEDADVSGEDLLANVTGLSLPGTKNAIRWNAGTVKRQLSNKDITFKGGWTNAAANGAGIYEEVITCTIASDPASL